MTDMAGAIHSERDRVAAVLDAFHRDGDLPGVVLGSVCRICQT